MPASAHVFVITSPYMVDVAKKELEELGHEMILAARSLEEALSQALILEELPATVVVIDADHYSQTVAEELVATIARLSPETIIISWSTSPQKTPWAKYHATKANATGKVPSLAMIVSLAS